MTKKELVKSVAQASGLTQKDSAMAIDAFMSSVEDALMNGEKVNLVGFGVFQTNERAARSGRNPKNGEALEIPACTYPKFRPSKCLKEKIIS